MARGKIQIKKIDNLASRQVTYSKRRNGLFKKAKELTVLCDAKICIIMFSGTGRLHEFISPSTSTKQIFDEYQKTMGIDLWSQHYERMQEHLKKLKEVNRNLRKEISWRMGESLDELSFDDLRGLEQDMDGASRAIRDRVVRLLGPATDSYFLRNRVINNQIETSKKKVRNVEEINRNLLLELEARDEDPHCGSVDNGEDYHSVIGFQNIGPNIFSLRLQPNQPHLHNGSRSDIKTYPLLEEQLRSLHT